MDPFLEAIERIDEIKIDEKLKPVFIESMKLFSVYFSEHPQLTVDIDKLFNEKLFNNLVITTGESSSYAHEGGHYNPFKNTLNLSVTDKIVATHVFTHEFIHFIVHNNPKGNPLPTWVDEMMTESTAFEICGKGKPGDFGYTRLLEETQVLDTLVEKRDYVEFLNGDFIDYLKRNNLDDLLDGPDMNSLSFDGTPLKKRLVQLKAKQSFEKFGYVDIDDLLILTEQLTRSNLGSCGPLPPDFFDKVLEDELSQYDGIVQNIDTSNLSEVAEKFRLAKFAQEKNLNCVHLVENKTNGTRLIIYAEKSGLTGFGQKVVDDTQMSYSCHGYEIDIDNVRINQTEDLYKLIDKGYAIQTVNANQASKYLQEADEEYQQMRASALKEQSKLKHLLADPNFYDLNSDQGNLCLKLVELMQNNPNCVIKTDQKATIGVVKEPDKMSSMLMQLKKNELESPYSIDMLENQAQIDSYKVRYCDDLIPAIDDYIKNNNIQPSQMLQVAMPDLNNEYTPMLSIMTDEKGFKINPNLALVWNKKYVDKRNQSDEKVQVGPFPNNKRGLIVSELERALNKTEQNNKQNKNTDARIM